MVLFLFPQFNHLFQTDLICQWIYGLTTGSNPFHKKFFWGIVSLLETGELGGPPSGVWAFAKVGRKMGIISAT